MPFRSRPQTVIGLELARILRICADAIEKDLRGAQGVGRGGVMPHLQLAATAASPITIEEAVDGWMKNLAARGKKPGSMRTFRSLVLNAAPVLGWRTIADIDAESLAAWMESKRAAGEWMGTTFNHNLSAFQSFSRFLAKRKWLPSDPLTIIDRADDDGGAGARPATADEARDIIRFAWERGQIDKRARGNRALVWHCLFAMGLRVGEPERLRWRHLVLDDPIPHVRWERAISKNKRDAEVALCPESVGLLLAHRQTVPCGPEDPVFPIVPPRHTFNHDRDGAGVRVLDARGLKLSSHSARKFLATTLTEQGVHPSVRDAIMRHAGGVQGRYSKISLEAQAKALAGLPALWPRLVPENRERVMINPLTRGSRIADTPPVTPLETHQLDSAPPSRREADGVTTQSPRRRGSIELESGSRESSVFGVEDQYDNGHVRTHRFGNESGVGGLLSDEFFDRLAAAFMRLRRGAGRDDAE